jgi:hypothetical protein
LLARLFQQEAAPWVLKGGYALELRFKAARSTVDIDLTLQQVVAATSVYGDANQVVRAMLQSAVDITLGDWFEFVIGSPVMDLAAAPYGGARFPVEARMDERTFARFHLDAGIGDVIMPPLETIECRDWLGFAGIESARVRMIAREQQFAEKIHAYRETVGVYPLLSDETCWFLAADFDKKTWEYDSQAFLETCREVSVPAALERSRSGKGGHIWIFFERALPAIAARKLGCLILTRTMERRHQVGLDSYDRFFPNQDTMPKGGLGNLIALPLQFGPRKSGNSLKRSRNLKNVLGPKL